MNADSIYVRRSFDSSIAASAAQSTNVASTQRTAYMMGGILLLSSAADLQSTLAARHRLGANFREQNPIMRPLLASPPAAAGAMIAVNYLTIRESLKLRREHQSGWWTPIVISIVGHGVAAIHNQRLH